MMISIWARKVFLMAILLVIVPASSFRADASDATIPHRGLWPDSINSPAEFDRASRAEILVFAEQLAKSDAFTVDALKARLDVDAVDANSVERLRHKLWRVLAENYAIAAADCVSGEAFCPENLDAGSFRHEAEAFSGARIPPRYGPWFDDAVRFHRSYLNELLLLAAVFPRRNSEVDTFNDNELPGWELPDRHFLLSFDDGPTRGAKQGPNADNTDRTLAMLRSNRVNAVFFAVGESFQARLRDSSVEAMKALYSGMCVGSHGRLHESHATWPQWQESVSSSSQLVHDTVPDSYVPAFRPPYGQRPPDSGPYLQGHGLKLVLWNIDSHDWDDGLTADDVEQRVMSLMLLWRRGVILFHDYFPRARVAAPRLITWLTHDGVTWADCHDVTGPVAALDGRSSASK
jgi:peptidoglycan/xylan/chitin deacetylase (PgdA/CDA1 family)